MLQAFIITLREGVEASLIVGIVFAYLTKIGRSELKRIVFWALGAALAASICGAIILARTQFNTDVFEGWVMLGAAALRHQHDLWYMHRVRAQCAAPSKRRSPATPAPKASPK